MKNIFGIWFSNLNNLKYIVPHVVYFDQQMGVWYVVVWLKTFLAFLQIFPSFSNTDGKKVNEQKIKRNNSE